MSPVDTSRLNALLGKQAFAPSDFCATLESTATVKVSQSLLKCTGNLCFSYSFTNPDTQQQGGNGFAIPLGREVSLQFSAVDANGISGVAVSSNFFDVISSNYTTTTMAPASRLSLSAQSVEVPVTADAGVRADGTVTLLARKPSTNALIQLAVSPSDTTADPTVVQLTPRITGTNDYSSVSSSVSTMNINDQTVVTISILDKINKPVEDAHVTLSECDGTPLGGNEQDLQGDGSRGKGQGGAYSFKVKAAGIGTIGVRVDEPDFPAFDSCGADNKPTITVNPGDFLTADQQTLEFNSVFTSPASKVITLHTTVAIASQVQATAYCGSPTAPTDAGMLQISNSNFKLQDQQQVTVTLTKPATAQCAIVFNAQASPGTTTVLTMPVDINSQPPTPSPTPPYPPISAGISMNTDPNGFAQGFYSLAGLGNITECKFTPTGTASALPPASVTISNAECAAGIAAIEVNLDLSDPTLCFNPDPRSPSNALPLTGRVSVSRTQSGFPVADYIVSLAVRPDASLLAQKPCAATATPTPTGTPLCPPVPTCTPGYNAVQTGTNANGCTTISCQLPSTTATPTPSAASSNYPAVPSPIQLKLDQTAHDEEYYSLSTIQGTPSGCDIVTLDATATSPKNFITVDSAACATGVLHIVADYAAYPMPPGLYKGLTQQATARITIAGKPPYDIPVTVSAATMPNLPANPVVCGDGVCTAGVEDYQNCPKDCHNPPSCTDGIKNGDEQGIDCGGSCPNNCTYAQYAPLPGIIPIKLSQDGT